MNLTDTKLQLLAEHYKNTFDFLQSKLKQRDRVFLFVLVILILMLFQINAPQESEDMIFQLISSKLDISTQMDMSFIQSIIWFGLLADTLKYFQLVVFIERQYDYLHQLEKQLSEEYEGKAFTREGKSYLKDYPEILSWASYLYTVLFPLILMFICGFKIGRELKTFGFQQATYWFNTVICLIITISVALYLAALHHKKIERVLSWIGRIPNWIRNKLS